MEWVGESEVTSVQLKKSTVCHTIQVSGQRASTVQKTEPTEYQMTQVYMCQTAQTNVLS